MTTDPAKACEQERILVIRFSSLGDVLLCAPAIRALRNRFPQSRIEFLVAAEYREAAELIPGLDAVLVLDRAQGFAELLRLRKSLVRRYTILVDLQNSLRSTFLRWTVFPIIWVRALRYRLRRWLLIHAKINLYRTVRPVSLRYLDAVAELGAGNSGQEVQLSVPRDAVDWNARFRAALSSHQPIVILCPGAQHFTKRWPKENWINLASQLTHRGFSVVVVGAADEESLVRSVCEPVTGATALWGEPLANLAALFATAGVVVSNDSGLMHLACGVGARVVAIFGPTVKEFGFFPYGNKIAVLEHNLPCRPCSAHGGKRCPKQHFHCMKYTRPGMVYDAVLQLTTLMKAEPTNFDLPPHL